MVQAQKLSKAWVAAHSTLALLPHHLPLCFGDNEVRVWTSGRHHLLRPHFVILDA